MSTYTSYLLTFLNCTYKIAFYTYSNIRYDFDERIYYHFTSTLNSSI